ncbi:MAG: trypsin-like peptidase domain-containing protein [Planctomycetota bacterium]|nr:trypsin-like peptidase domain-containing protein [Planctomycetota bacterium]
MTRNSVRPVSVPLAIGFLVFVGVCFGERVVANAQSASEKSNLSAGVLLAPKAFRAAAARVMKSLVTIDSFGGVGSVQGRIGGIRRQGEGSTTGIIVSPDGYVITSSFNFIQKPPIITLTTFDGKKHVAKAVANDHTRKLTLLKIENATGLMVPRFLSPDNITVGQWAISVGIGFGDINPAISAGIVSAKNRAFGRAIQTDANISPANYGGPLLDIRGQVIGVCVPLNPKSNSLASGVEWYDSGIGFAIPLNDQSIIEKLKTGKDIYPGRMGVTVKPENLDGSGVKVVSVLSKSAAEKAGLKKNDLILKLGKYTVQDPAQFRSLVGRFNAGQTTQVRLKRGGKEQTSDLTFSIRTAKPRPQTAIKGPAPGQKNKAPNSKDPKK